MPPIFIGGQEVTKRYVGTQEVVAAYVGAQQVFGASFDVYVDSVNGNDSNSGASAAQAKQTIGAITLETGLSIGLARGSYWREQLTTTVGITVGPYGAGAPPVIDGADLVGTWTQPDSVTYPDVWSQTWTRSGAVGSASEKLGLWLNGVRPRFAASVADLQTNGGWYAIDRVTTTTTIYVKSTTNPNVSGDLYEVTRRSHAIECYNATSDSTIWGFEAKRCVGHYNALSMGTGSAYKLLLRDGTIHHTVTQAASMTDVILTESDKASAPLPLAAYRLNGNGFSPQMRRLLCLFGSSDARATPAFIGPAVYAHSSTPGTIDALNIEQSAFVGMNGPDMTASTAGGVVDGAYLNNVVNLGVDMGQRTTLIRALMLDTAGSAASGGTLFARNLGTNLSGSVTDCAAAGSAARGVTLQIKASAGIPLPLLNTSIYNGALDVANTGISANYLVNDTPEINFVLGTGAAYTGDHNVWAWYQNSGQGANSTAVRGIINGANTFTLAELQAATGQDAHSVSLKKSEQVSGGAYAFWLGVSLGTGGPDVGDFRINPNARVYGGNGTMYVGTFTDGVPITNAGPQTHWDWNARAIASGPPERPPVMPATLGEMRAYIENPEDWNFYP